jgi:hypothetical protein
MPALSFPLVTNDVITHDVILNPAKGPGEGPYVARPKRCSQQDQAQRRNQITFRALPRPTSMSRRIVLAITPVAMPVWAKGTSPKAVEALMKSRVN